MKHPCMAMCVSDEQDGDKGLGMRSGKSPQEWRVEGERG